MTTTKKLDTLIRLMVKAEVLAEELRDALNEDSHVDTVRSRLLADRTILAREHAARLREGA